MKLCIVGSRSITDFDVSPYILSDVDTVISGGADGIDRLAEQYADLHRLSKYILRPRYDLYGRAAPRGETKKWSIWPIPCSSYGTVSPRGRSILCAMRKK